jgi:hypothetical protein
MTQWVITSVNCTRHSGGKRATGLLSIFPQLWMAGDETNGWHCLSSSPLNCYAVKEAVNHWREEAHHIPLHNCQLQWSIPFPSLSCLGYGHHREDSCMKDVAPPPEKPRGCPHSLTTQDIDVGTITSLFTPSFNLYHSSLWALCVTNQICILTRCKRTSLTLWTVKLASALWITLWRGVGIDVKRCIVIHLVLYWLAEVSICIQFTCHSDSLSCLECYQVFPRGHCVGHAVQCWGWSWIHTVGKPCMSRQAKFCHVVMSCFLSCSLSCVSSCARLELSTFFAFRIITGTYQQNMVLITVLQS